LYSCDIQFCTDRDEVTHLPMGDVLFFVNTYDILTDIYIYIYIWIYILGYILGFVMFICVDDF
jgi:hypothetical protein